MWAADIEGKKISNSHYQREKEEYIYKVLNKSIGPWNRE